MKKLYVVKVLKSSLFYLNLGNFKYNFTVLEKKKLSNLVMKLCSARNKRPPSILILINRTNNSSHSHTLLQRVFFFQIETYTQNKDLKSPASKTHLLCLSQAQLKLFFVKLNPDVFYCSDRSLEDLLPGHKNFVKNFTDRSSVSWLGMITG